MNETGSCTEIRSLWYTVREGRGAVAMRDVVIQLPGGETETFVDPQEYSTAFAVADIVTRA